LKKGDTIKRPIFAKTLEHIAETGIDSFYNGWIAEALVKTIQEAKGIATLTDFFSYEARLESIIQSII
jgi:gamma-glutamyltranspeptidase